MFSRKSVALLVLWFLAHCLILNSIAGAQTLTAPTTSAVLVSSDLDRDGRLVIADIRIRVAQNFMRPEPLGDFMLEYAGMVNSLKGAPVTTIPGNLGAVHIRARFVQSLTPGLRKYRLSTNLNQMRTVLTADQQLDGVVFRSDAMPVDFMGNTKPVNTTIMLDTLGDPNMGWPSVPVATTADRIIAVVAKQIRDVRGNTLSYISPPGVKWDGSEALVIDLPRANLPSSSTSGVTTGNGTVTLTNVNVPGAQTVRIYQRTATGTYTLVTEIPNGGNVVVRGPNGQTIFVGIAGVLNGNEGTVNEIFATPSAPPLPNFAWQGGANVSPNIITETTNVTVTAVLASTSVTVPTTIPIVCRLDGQQQRFTVLAHNLPGTTTSLVTFRFTNVIPDNTDQKAVSLTIDPDHVLRQAAVGPQIITTTVSAPRPNARIERVVFSSNPVQQGRPTTATVFLRSENVGRVRVGHLVAMEHFCGPGMYGSCQVELGRTDFNVQPTTSNVTYTATLTINPIVGTVLPDGVTATIPVTFTLQVDDIIEKSVVDNHVTTSVVVRGNPQPNMKIISASFSPARPRVGESVTVTIAATRSNIAASVNTDIFIVRIENGNPLVADAPLSVAAGSGPLTKTFTVTAESPMNFQVTLNRSQAIAEDQSDNTLVITVPTIPPPGPKDDFFVQKRGSQWFGVLENVDRHLGEPRANDNVKRFSDIPAALNWSGNGQALTVSTSGTLEFPIDSAIAGDHRIGLTFNASSGPMFLIPSTFTGSQFQKPVSTTTGSMMLCYRVRSTPQGRIVTNVDDAFVRIRPYTVGSDPRGLETTRPADLTDLLTDPSKFMLVQSASVHGVAPMPSVATDGVALVRLNPRNSTESFDPSGATTIGVMYDRARDMVSVDLTGVSTAADLTLQVWVRTGGQAVQINAASFGFSGSDAASGQPTHSLIDPALKIFHLRWNNATRMWGTARGIVSSGSGGGGGSGS